MDLNNLNFVGQAFTGEVLHTASPDWTIQKPDPLPIKHHPEVDDERRIVTSSLLDMFDSPMSISSYPVAAVALCSQDIVLARAVLRAKWLSFIPKCESCENIRASFVLEDLDFTTEV